MRMQLLYRMVVVFALVMLFATYVLPYMGDGPLWRKYTQIEAENCKSTFWSNVFALGNMLDVDKPVNTPIIS